VLTRQRRLLQLQEQQGQQQQQQEGDEGLGWLHSLRSSGKRWKG
jgi:hypothetical protein